MGLAGGSVTVKSPDGVSATYTFTPTTKVHKGKQTATTAQITTNDRVRVLANKTGATNTATRIGDAGPAKGRNVPGSGHTRAVAGPPGHHCPWHPDQPVLGPGPPRRYWYTVSRLMPNSRANRALGSPAATRSRRAVICSSVRVRLRPR